MLSEASTSVSLNVYWQRPVVFDEHGRALKGSGGLSWHQMIVQDVLGIYHVGVAVHGVEYTFGNSHAPFSTRLGGTAGGVVTHKPSEAGPQNLLKQSIQMGMIHLPQNVVEQTALCMSLNSFSRDSYNRYQHNCVDFAKEFLLRLNVQIELPTWCCRGSDAARLAGLGRDKSKSTSSPSSIFIAGKAKKDFVDWSSASTIASSSDLETLLLDDVPDDGIQKANWLGEFTDESAAEEDSFLIPDDESDIQRVMKATWGNAQLRPSIESLLRESCNSLTEGGSGAYCQMKAIETRDVAETAGMGLTAITEIMAVTPKSIDPHQLFPVTPKLLDPHQTFPESEAPPPTQPSLLQATSAFDGEWFKDGELKAVINGETIDVDGLNFCLSFPTPTTVHFRGRDDLQGCMDFDNKAINWTNGSVWHKQAVPVEAVCRIQELLSPSTWQKSKRHLLAATTVHSICLAVKHELIDTTSI
jgi:hypothetical protein